MAPRGVRVSLRTCAGCRRVRPKADLVRIARLSDGAAAVDLAGRLPGRGAYVCRTTECVASAEKRLARALRGATVDVERLRQELNGVLDEEDP